MGAHRKGRARLPRDLAYREPYVPPLEGEIKDADFDRRLAELGWKLGVPDTRMETPPMTKARTNVDDDVRVPPHFDAEVTRNGNGGNVHLDNDGDEDQDDYDQDEEESDELIVKSGDDEDEDEYERDPVVAPAKATRKPEPEDEPEDEPEPEAEDEPEPEAEDEPEDDLDDAGEDDLDDADEDEPEPVKVTRKQEPKPAAKADPKRNKPPKTEKAPEPQQPSQELIDAVAGALTGPVVDAVTARLETMLPQPRRAERVEKAEKPKPAPEKEHETASIQVQPFTSDHVYALARRPPTSLRGVRDLAMLMLGLSAALKRSEVVALRLEHIAFSEDGIAVVLPRSKDIMFVPTVVDRICTVAALANWVVASGIKGGYLFRRITNDKLDANRERRIPKKETTKAVKRAMRRVGLDPAGFDWRSMRAGFLVAYEASRTVDQKIDALRRGS